MTNETIRALLVEDNPGDARLVRETLRGALTARFEVEDVDRLEGAIARLRRPGIDVVLLDLSLPDSHGHATIARIHREAPAAPVIALSGNDDESLIQDAVKAGAEDYLVKGSFTAELLARSIRYAIDRRRARQELSQARDSALESARLRAEFLANMSHEIRTPLNGLIGMTRLLMDTGLTAEQREMIEIAAASSDALLRIVNDILDFSKLAAGKAALEEADFALGATVENVIRLFAEPARARTIALDALIDDDVPATLAGDAGRLKQVLANLVGNAIKFTPHGEVAVRVGRVAEEAGEVTLRFQVRDTGIGIPLETQRYIFQAFAQGDGSTTRRFGGTGLGLAISAQLVELMGGNIGVISEPGDGSTFWFTAVFKARPDPVRSEAAHRRMAGSRALIVDPSPAGARLVGDHLRAWGMRCESAATVAESLRTLRAAARAGDPFALAMVELGPSELDGLGLARAIHADPALASIRLLGFHSLGARPTDSALRAAGIRARLAKPIRQSELFNTLTTLLAADSTAAAPPVASAPAPPARIQSRVAAETRARARLLLVEDNLVNQRVMVRTIERIGYRADTALNGRIACAMLERAAYDIVLMDCQMPEMDGYSATRELRRREGRARHTAVIGITAHALAGDREQCLRAGMDDYLAKPVMPEELTAMLDKWVEAAEAARAKSADGAGAAAGREAAEVLDAAVVARLADEPDGDGGGFLASLIGVYLADLASRQRELNDAFGGNNAVAARAAAHALKGASAELGARRVVELCARVENLSRAGELEPARALLAELERESERARVALEALRIRSRA